MGYKKNFPFERARRVTPEEVEEARLAIEKLTGKPRPPRPGRPAKSLDEKYVMISLRLHPEILSRLKLEAERTSVPYQTIIGKLLFERFGAGIDK